MSLRADIVRDHGAHVGFGRVSQGKRLIYKILICFTAITAITAS